MRRRRWWPRELAPGPHCGEASRECEAVASTGSDVLKAESVHEGEQSERFLFYHVSTSRSRKAEERHDGKTTLDVWR